MVVARLYRRQKDTSEKLVTDTIFALIFCSDDEQVGTAWVQALYRATGQSYRPIPPTKDSSANAEKQLDVPGEFADRITVSLKVVFTLC